MRQSFTIEFDMLEGDMMWKVVHGRAGQRFIVNTSGLRNKNGGPGFCSLAMFELGRDFDKKVCRVTLRPPGGQDRTEATLEFFEAWMDIWEAEKVRQFELLKGAGAMLPQLPLEWGEVDSPQKMPCVAWIHVPQQERS